MCCVHRVIALDLRCKHVTINTFFFFLVALSYFLWLLHLNQIILLACMCTVNLL